VRWPKRRALRRRLRRRARLHLLRRLRRLPLRRRLRLLRNLSCALVADLSNCNLREGKRKLPKPMLSQSLLNLPSLFPITRSSAWSKWKETTVFSRRLA